MKKFFGLLFGTFFAMNIFSQAEAVGNDTTAPNEKIEVAIDWAVGIAKDNSHGYSQGAGIGK